MTVLLSVAAEVPTIKPPVIPGVPDWAINVIVASTILVFGIWFAYFVSRLVRKKAAKHPRIDTTLGNFFGLMIRYAIIIVVLLIVLQQFGIQTTSLVAVLGASALAIGLALQGTLTNVASGIMLALMRPYHIGDYVEVNGKEGTVTDLDLFFTQILTGDEKRIYVPNGTIVSNPIINFTRGGLRRATLTIGIGYGENIDHALSIMDEVMRRDVRVLDAPEPAFGVAGFSDFAVKIEGKASTATADHDDYLGDMMKAVKLAFDREGIEIPNRGRPKED